ncbi:MAG TPA: tail fiber domain-containing protein, partial [Blastocatellia bacterium]
HNAFFGTAAGDGNTTGADNAYFGWWAGKNSETGDNNSFFGAKAGQDTSHGDNNSFFGYRSGLANTTGSGNSLFGAYAEVSTHNLTNAAAIGSRAYVSRSNSLVLGQIAGVNGATADTNVGIGVTGPLDRLHVNGIIRVETLGQAGSQSLCRNAKQQISPCSSSLRYKTALAPFRDGLSLVNRLNPISFTWKDGGMRDLGLGAEDVAAVEPLLVIRNDKGEVEGVKYDRITLVLLNAVKEQQELIDKQQQRIEALRKLVCQNNPQAEACK